MDNSLGSFDPNVLPMDAFDLRGKATDARRVIGLKEPWVFGSAVASAKWTLGVGYTPGDVVYHDEDGLVYMNLVATDSIEPDYSDIGVEGVTWKWVAGAISGFVSGRGWWNKFSSGLLLQESIDFTVSNTGTISNGLGTTSGTTNYGNQTWTYPIGFHATPRVSPGRSSKYILRVDFSSASATSALLQWQENGSSSGSANAVAFGRWKA